MSAPPPIPSRLRSAPLPPLDLRLLADLPTLALQSRYMVEGFLSGRHRSPQKGSSVEFAEYRSYQPGDDLRRLDWRLYARNDRLHLRQYEDETQLRVYLVLDRSASMNFRSRASLLLKIEYARIVCAALAMLAQRQGDAYGLGLAGPAGLEDFLRARTNARHWRQILGRLEVLTAGGVANLPLALNSLAELLPRRSMVVIASDFYDETEALRRVLGRLRHDRHDLIGLHVLDPQELEFDLDAAGTFVDAESAARLPLDASSVRAGYLQRFGAFCREIDDLFHAAGGEAVRLRTDRAPIDALAAYLARRGK